MAKFPKCSKVNKLELETSQQKLKNDAPWKLGFSMLDFSLVLAYLKGMLSSFFTKSYLIFSYLQKRDPENIADISRQFLLESKQTI